MDLARIDPNEQLPPSDLDAPFDLRARTIDYDWLQTQLPRFDAMLAHIKQLFDEQCAEADAQQL